MSRAAVGLMRTGLGSDVMPAAELPARIAPAHPPPPLPPAAACVRERHSAQLAISGS